MHSFKLKVMVLVAFAPLATACSSIFGTSASADLPEIRVAGAGEQPAVQAAIAIEEGRAHLTAGNAGLAIESFQRALALGESVGPAANGMGVAYARIGRADLARRYFSQAIAVSPEEHAYLANLDRLESTPSLAVATQVTMRPSAKAPEKAEPRAAAPQVVRVGTSGDGNYRALGMHGVGETGYGVGKSRRRIHANTRLFSDTAPGIRHVHGGLLMTRIDDAEILIRHHVEDRQDMIAGQAEDIFHILELKRFADQVAPRHSDHDHLRIELKGRIDPVRYFCTTVPSKIAEGPKIQKFGCVINYSRVFMAAPRHHSG